MSEIDLSIGFEQHVENSPLDGLANLLTPNGSTVPASIVLLHNLHEDQREITMLDLTTLRQRCKNGEQFQYLFFWGHQVPEDGTVKSSCLSQWYPASFELEGIVYPTAEHWMMASKARLFGDEEILQEILETDDPKTAKALGRKVKDFDDDIWKSNCRRLVTEGNVAKFGQNESLRTFLLGTGKHVIVEASPFDRIWGIGLSVSNEKSKHPSTWLGQNLLGFALMDVRERVKG